MENSIGENIRFLRKCKKLSQSELGAILGYSARTVSDWENGNTEPNITAIKALVRIFEVTYEELLGDI